MFKGLRFFSIVAFNCIAQSYELVTWRLMIENRRKLSTPISIEGWMLASDRDGLNLSFLLMSTVSWSRILIPFQSISSLALDWCSQIVDCLICCLIFFAMWLIHMATLSIHCWWTLCGTVKAQILNNLRPFESLEFIFQISILRSRISIHGILNHNRIVKTLS